MQKEKLKMIIFDMDGVILDSEPFHENARQMIYERLGLVPDETFPEAVGNSASEFWRKVTELCGIEADPLELEAEQYRLVAQQARELNTPPSDGLIELLEWAKEYKILVGLASSSVRQLVDDVLEHLGIGHYFFCTVSSNDIARRKPDPDAYLKALELADIGPDSAVAVEDSRTGVLAAKKAGLFTFGYVNPTSGAQNLEAADLVIKSLREIIPFLEEN